MFLNHDWYRQAFSRLKPLGCYGDGGACFTNDDQLAMKMRHILESWSGSVDIITAVIGLNARMDTIQAAVLLEKLGYFPRRGCGTFHDRRQLYSYCWMVWYKLLAWQMATHMSTPNTLSRWINVTQLPPGSRKGEYLQRYTILWRCTCNRHLNIWNTRKGIFLSRKWSAVRC